MITGYKWELYNVAEDPTESNDLAAKMPDKLKEMQDLFYAEAAKNDVLPLDNSSLARWNAPRPNLTGGRTQFTYTGELSGVPASAAPRILDRGYTITAEVEIPEGGAEGMIVTEGGRFGGYGLFLSKGEFGFGRGKPVFLYNLLDLKRTAWEGPELEPGKHTIVFDFKPDGPGLGKGGTGVLSVDGKEVARNTLDHTTPVTFPEDESFDVGLDTRTPLALVEYRYDSPFRFTGKIDKLTFDLEAGELAMNRVLAVAAVAEISDRPRPRPRPCAGGTALAGRRPHRPRGDRRARRRHRPDRPRRRLLARPADPRHADLQRRRHAPSRLVRHRRRHSRYRSSGPPSPSTRSCRYSSDVPSRPARAAVNTSVPTASDPYGFHTLPIRFPYRPDPC